MRADFNPFDRKLCTKTEHGTINYEHSMGTVYVTHRRKQHYFKKYQGYGISISELEIAYNKNVHWILIIYHRENGTNIAYRIPLKKLSYIETYNNKGDKQKIIPIKEMEILKESGWF